MVTLHRFSTLLLVLVIAVVTTSHAQQLYTRNAMLDCYATNSSSTLGYSCNGAQQTCSSFAIFRSATNYQTPISIAYFLTASAADIAKLNSITDIASIPLNQLVLVPLTCSCSNTTSDGYYQHDSSYLLKSLTETYQIVANDTYQGLSTCQAIIKQNPTHESHKLKPGMNITVPLRCACPTRTQIAVGFKYLLSYLVTWNDSVPSIAEMFKTDEQAIWDANSLKVGDIIFPFTTLLVPLKTAPTKDLLVGPPVPPPPSTESPVPLPAVTNKSNKTWVIAGIAIGVGVLALCVILLVLFHNRHRRRRPVPYTAPEEKQDIGVSSDVYNGIDPEKPLYSSSSILSEEARFLVGSLAVYKYEELQKATGFFGEDHIIKGSVYRGLINGDLAAVKRMKGDVSKEINILKYMNHTNLIILSGYCLHDADTYLVFEFAEKGSLHDWLHSPKSASLGLGWKLRVQIAHDVADALNYLHNYTTPMCIHKDLRSSNILLDAEFRAKIANFGLARSAEEEHGLQMTSHVVGTHGYMSPEYLMHGLISPKLDIFAFGVVLLELLSGKEAFSAGDGERKGEALLYASIGPVLTGEDSRDKLKQFIDPCLGDNYQFESAFAMAQLAKQCVVPEPLSRPTIAQVFVALSEIHSAMLDWDPSLDNTKTGSTIGGR